MSNSRFGSRDLTLAAAISLTLMAAQAHAQQASRTAPADTGALEEVVVTGSFIEGTPEDSALPVEVLSFEDLQDMGRPSNLDMIKTMSESGGVAGENNRVNFYPIGAATINLRSLGSRFTTVVFNGRRFPEQFSVNTGRFNNISWIPNAAIGRVETLKAGGSATYGADAVAGVVNYVTRSGFDGLELNADYRFIEDSSGDYNADILWGKDLGDKGNVLVSLSYQHRSTLHTLDRDWYRYEYLENPASWQSLTAPISNPGTMILQTAPGVSITPATATASQLQMGSAGTIRDLNCAELGGFRGWSSTVNPGCYSNTAELEDLVSEQNSYTAYLEHNVTIGNGIKFHTEVLGYRQDIPDIALGSTFVSNPAAWPLAPSVGGAARSQQVTSVGNPTNAYFVSGANPAVGVLLNGLRNPDNSLALTPAQIAAIQSTGRVSLQNFQWKPFGNGGSPLGDVDKQEGHLTMFRITEAIGGPLPSFWGTDLEWEVGLTYSEISDRKETQDMLVDRLQAALNGFGGPNCTGGTAGANGCQFFNPFSSAIERNVFAGGVNPGYVGTGTYAGYTPGAGLSNSRDLVAWMYQPIWFDRDYRNFVVDPIVRGNLGWELPGGPVAIAFGGQFRRQDERVTMDALSNRNNNPCTQIGEYNCTQASQQGVFVYNRQGNVFGAAAPNYRPEGRHYPVGAAFFETKLPVWTTVDLSLAGRYEKFFSDVTDIDNDVFVPAAAIKWQPLDWLGVRTSWGKTFSQVNPPRARDPLFANSAASAKYQGLGGAGVASNYTTNNWANLDVKPERGDYLSVGFLVNAGNFTANVDYYNITVGDYTRTMTAANVLDAVAPAGTTGGPANTIPLNCSSPAFTQGMSSLNGRTLVELAGGAQCTPGMTMANLVGANINFFGGNGQTNSGELKTDGIDFSASYRFEGVFGGTLTPTVDYSRVLKWELGDFTIGGVPVAKGYDGLGFVNLSTGRVGQSVAKYRATIGLLYNHGNHTINIQGQYVPSIINENPTDFDPSNTKNANLADANGVGANAGVCTVGGPVTTDLGNTPAGAGAGQYGTGVVPTGATGAGARGFCASDNTTTNAGKLIEELINIDLIYRVQLPMEMTGSLVVTNVFDKDPSFFRGIVPYNTAYGSPLGRTYKLGFSKRF
jgi:iron complex outermembrane receptor protein